MGCIIHSVSFSIAEECHFHCATDFGIDQAIFKHKNKWLTSLIFESAIFY